MAITKIFQEELDDQEKSDLVGVIRDVLTTLDYRERKIVEFRFFNGMTQEECGRKFNLGRGAVWNIEQKVIRKLRHPWRASKLYEAWKGWLEGEPINYPTGMWFDPTKWLRKQREEQEGQVT